MLTEELLCFPISFDQFFVTGTFCSTQCRHNDFEHAKNSRPGFFIIITESETSDVWVVDGSHNNLDIPTEEKDVISNLMELKLISINMQSFAVVHG